MRCSQLFLNPCSATSINPSTSITTEYRHRAAPPSLIKCELFESVLLLSTRSKRENMCAGNLCKSSEKTTDAYEDTRMEKWLIFFHSHRFLQGNMNVNVNRLSFVVTSHRKLINSQEIVRFATP